MKVFLADSGYIWYFHWFIYMLSRFLMYNYENDPEIIYTYLPDDENSYHYESLKYMFPTSIIKNVNKENNLKIETINNFIGHSTQLIENAPENEGILDIHKLCKQIDNDLYDYSTPDLLPSYKYFNFIRTKFINYSEDVNLDYVFISRKLSYVNRSNKNERHIKNEDDLMKALEQFGFKYILLEEFTLKQKIGLFKNAKIIISPWGAALTNCCFSSEKTIIIQLDPCHNFTSLVHYKHICKLFNIPHYIISDSYNVDNDCNYDVNINSIVNFIKSLL